LRATFIHSILIALFILLGLETFAQQHTLHSYSLDKGLAQSQVYAMFEDSRGYIWMGTQGGGLSRFDGKQFSATFTVRDGLSNNFVNSIYEDSDDWNQGRH
jgi:ligand-binding sensor domain-containing protein